MKRDLGKLKDLSAPDLQMIAADIDQSGIRQAAAAASTQHGRPIDNTCIQRFNERSVARHFLSDGPDTAAAATEILRFAASGTPDFTEATLKVLEQTAFKLALAAASLSDSAPSAGPARRQEERTALAQITTMLCRFRTTAVRERMARVQEEKLRLREKELELKKPKAQSTPPPAREGDALGPYAVTYGDLQKRVRAKFGPPLVDQGPFSPEVLNQVIRFGPDPGVAPVAPQTPASRPSQSPPATVESPASIANTPASLEPIDSFSPSSQFPPPSKLPVSTAAPERAPTPAAEPAPYRQTENFPAPHPQPPPPAEAEDENPTNLPEPPLTPAEQRAKEYAIRRARFALYRNGEGLPPDVSWRDLCPCGATPPCPEHGDRLLRLRHHPMSHPDYIDALREAGIPIFTVVKGPAPAFHLHATRVT